MQSFHDDIKAILPRLRAIARAMARDPHLADDLVQEAVAKALAARHSFTPGTNFGGWIYRILRNEFLSGVRRARPTVDVADLPEGVLSRRPEQEDRLIARRLVDELAVLPPHQREALVLVAIDGLGYDEVGRRMNVPVGTAKSWVFRARRALQVRLLDDGESRRPARHARDASARRPAGVNEARSSQR